MGCRPGRCEAGPAAPKSRRRRGVMLTPRPSLSLISLLSAFSLTGINWNQLVSTVGCGAAVESTLRCRRTGAPAPAPENRPLWACGPILFQKKKGDVVGKCSLFGRSPPRALSSCGAVRLRAATSLRKDAPFTGSGQRAQQGFATGFLSVSYDAV